MSSTVNIISKDCNGVVDVYYYSYDSNNHTSSILPEQFLSLDEIVNDLPTRTDQADIDQIKNMKKDDLIILHHGFGTWIRNNYGLWMPNHPVTCGIHPDDYCFEIMKAFHDKLNTLTKDPYDQAMKII